MRGKTEKAPELAFRDELSKTRGATRFDTAIPYPLLPLLNCSRKAGRPNRASVPALPTPLNALSVAARIP